MPLITLRDAQLAFGDHPLLDRAHLSLEASQDVTPEVEAALFKAEMFERAFSVALSVAGPSAAYPPSFEESESTAAEIDATSLSG